MLFFKFQFVWNTRFSTISTGLHDFCLFYCFKDQIQQVFNDIYLCVFLEGGWASYQIFKEGGLTGSQGVAGKEGGDFFRGVGGGGCSCYIKNKLKSEIFNDKEKFISKNVFLCHSWELKLGNFN